MNFTISKSIEIIERTPEVLTTLLQNLTPAWTSANEGDETWSAFDIVGHLIHEEKTDWIPWAKIILLRKEHKAFEPYDRFAQFEESKGKSLKDLLQEFNILRRENIDFLKSLNLRTNNLTKEEFTRLSVKLPYSSCWQPG